MLLNKFQQKLLAFALAKRADNWHEMAKLINKIMSTLPVELAEKIKAGQQFNILDNSTNVKASFKVNDDCIIVNIEPTHDETFIIKISMFAKDKIISFLSNDEVPDEDSELILFEVCYSDKTKGKYSLVSFDNYDLGYSEHYLVKINKSANILNEKHKVYEVLDQESFYKYNSRRLHYSDTIITQYKSVATEIQRKLLGISINRIKRANKSSNDDDSSFEPF